MNVSENFQFFFKTLTHNEPFPWQEHLFVRFEQDEFPKDCVVPTGLGKTSIMAVWLLSLASHVQRGKTAGFPRRLIYVVNRRTVVDQSTQEAQELLNALSAKPELKPVNEALRFLTVYAENEQPFVISTLRGQFADNAEWRNDPARPAIIAGTVDMIGSRLLFSGYGCGYKSRPLHAGFLAQDCLLIHDEAHLEPAFQQLIETMKSEQANCGDPYPFHVIALTATSRSAQEKPFTLTEKDHTNEFVKKRITAKKGVSFREIKEAKKVGEEIAEFAQTTYQTSNQAILIFLNTLEDIQKAADALKKKKQHVQVLTGTQRGWERDRLAEEDPIFARFLPNPKTVSQEGATVYLLCTSAGEVGVNISADHLICDTVPIERMIQRFGRVNRFGEGENDAHIDIFTAKPDQVSSAQGGNEIDASEVKTNSKSPLAQACTDTLSLLQRLTQREDGRFSASPSELAKLPVTELLAAFSPEPIIPAVNEVLFDAWALTSIHKPLPGRPPVADWLHGIAEWDPLETYIAWREEVSLSEAVLSFHAPEDLLADYPLKPHELLRDRSSRIFKALKKKADELLDHPIWLVSENGSVDQNIRTLKQLSKQGEQALAGKTLLLPPEIGMLQNGLLDANAVFGENIEYDIADQWRNEQGEARRCRRLWDDKTPPATMRLVVTIDTRPDIDDENAEESENRRRYWHWYVRPRAADDDGSRAALYPQCLTHHLETAERVATALAEKLQLGKTQALALRFAAKNHDQGKARSVWQRAIGNHAYPEPTLAKSGGKMRPVELSRYRHEFGSLIDIQNDAEFLALTEDEQDLALHMIASHHGRARPHFSADEAFDPENKEAVAIDIAAEIPRRFARLQRRYGRWGLAYLESLLRAVDILASQDPNACDCQIDRNLKEANDEQ